MDEESSDKVNIEKSPKKSIADLFNDLPYRHYPSRHMIIYQGDKIEYVYYIISGYVRVYNITNKGNERTLVILGPGESMPIVQSEEAQYFYDALTDVEAAYGSYEQIIERFLEHKEYMEVAREAGVQLMQRMLEQLEVVSYDNANDKISKALEFLAKYYGKGDADYRTINFKLTHQELANLVNLTRETVTTVIHRLVRQQAIDLSDGGYISVHISLDKVNPDEEPKNLRTKLSKVKAGLIPNPEMSP
ncbi:MAG: Crp/Fnr family transcriptional regulator [Candidatus Saccharimonadales bacterium]